MMSPPFSWVRGATQSLAGLLSGTDKAKLDYRVSSSSPLSFDWYLSSVGNDSADGSITGPWLTLARVQAELNKYGPGALKQVRVYAAAGTYTAANLDGSALARGGRFVIQALSTTTLLSGTIIAGSTTILMNTSALSGTNNYQRKWIRRKSQAGVILDERQIVSNTTTTITPSVAFLSVPATTDTFEIYEPAVIFDGTAGMVTISNFRGMTAPGLRFALTTAASDLNGGGLYMADVRWLSFNSSAFFLDNTLLYTKSFELYGTSLGNCSMFMSATSGWASGISSPGATLPTQFLSGFMNVTDDGIWAGCGFNAVLASNGAMRINGGNWFGYACCNSLLFNLALLDTLSPCALLCGGSIDSPPTCGNALVVGYGILRTQYSQISPYPMLQLSCSGNFPTVYGSISFYSPAASLFLNYANINNTASGMPCVRSEQGGIVVVNSTCTGNASNAGYGLEARNGGQIMLSGALGIGGAAGDTRVDGANVQAKAFYSAANVANPATAQASGSKIVRIS